MPGRVQDKIAIVTGGGTGIGQGIAVRLAREGAKVVVANRDARTGEETVRLAQAAGRESGFGGSAIHVPTDITRETDCQALVQAAVSQFGGLDVLVNNAGVFPRATLEETTEELWDQIFSVNLKGVFFACKYAMPVMRERGGGSVINIGSINAYVGGGNLFAYSVSKGGLLTLTRNLAASWARHKVRVNFLNPGWVITPARSTSRAWRATTWIGWRSTARTCRWAACRHPRMPPGARCISRLTRRPWSLARR